MNPEALLVAMLEEWRRTHDAALEPLIETIGADVARMRGPIAAAPREHEAAWQELAKTRDPADVDRLLDSKWPRSTPLLRARVAALATF
jgi:hypothetical protein